MKIISYAVITAEGDLLNFETQSEAERYGDPIPVVETEEIIRYEA